MENLRRDHLRSSQKGPMCFVPMCFVPGAMGGWCVKLDATCVWANPPKCPERPLSRRWATAVTGGQAWAQGFPLPLRATLGRISTGSAPALGDAPPGRTPGRP
jgi:hypothetical protein